MVLKFSFHKFDDFYLDTLYFKFQVESVITHQEELIKRWHEKGGLEVSVESSSSQEKAVISARRSSSNASHSLLG